MKTIGETPEAMTEDAPNYSLGSDTKEENNKTEQKSVSLFDANNEKAQKDDPGQAAKLDFDSACGATSFNSILKQFGRHTNNSVNRDQNIEETVRDDHSERSFKAAEEIDNDIYSQDICKEAIANGDDIMKENEEKQENASDLEEIISFDKSVQHIEDRCKVKKNILDEFSTDIQEDKIDEISTLEDLLDNSILVSEYLYEFSPHDESDAEDEISEWVLFNATESLDENNKALQQEALYEISILEDAGKETHGGLISPNYAWDLHSNFFLLKMKLM